MIPFQNCQCHGIGQRQKCFCDSILNLVFRNSEGLSQITETVKLKFEINLYKAKYTVMFKFQIFYSFQESINMNWETKLKVLSPMQAMGWIEMVLY